MLTARLSRAAHAGVGPLAAVTLLVAVGIALPRAAQAAIRGTPGYSGTLSSNANIRKQQLLCDPQDPLRGSSSTTYDPTVSRLTQINPVALTPNDGYVITQAVVAVSDNGFVDVTNLANSGMPFSVPDQIGYVQVFWESTASPPSAAVGSGLAPNYELRDQGGVEGVDTHRLEFDYLPASDTVVATYTTYADPGRDNGGMGIRPDSLTSPLFTPNTVGPAQIAPVTVSGPLVPEPSGLALLGLGALAVARRSRRS
jgi:hypothetical protein